MKVLIATPEIEPLSGSTPLATAVHRLARELHYCPDSEVIVVLPASERILRDHAEELSDAGAVIQATGEGSSARVFEFRSGSGPQTLLLDAPELRDGFGEDLTAGALAERALRWADFLAVLITRLKPRIDIAHCFGWECALFPLLIRIRNLPFKSILTTAPSRGVEPGVASIKEAVRRAGFSELARIESVPEDCSLLAWSKAFADKVSKLGALTREDRSPSSVLRAKSRARAAALAACGLAENAVSPLFFVPALDASPLLTILDRTLESDARVVLRSLQRDFALETALRTIALRHPERFAWFEPGDSRAEELDWLAASDFFVLLPSDGDRPQSVADVSLALKRGCTPVLPHRAHFETAAGAARPGVGAPPAFTYRAEAPEAIWSTLKRCIKLHRNPILWKRQLEDVVRAGISDEGVTPEYSELYRQVIESALVGAA